MPESLRLNNTPISFYESDGSTRGDLVASGRLLMYDANVRESNNVRVNAGHGKGNASPRLDDIVYKQTSESHRAKLMLYCAKIACDADGRTAPDSYESFMRMQRDFMHDSIFMRALSGVMTEVIRPMLPYVISDAVGKLAQTVSVPMGETYEVQVGSTEIITFSDSDWGAVHSVPRAELYDTSFTLNPRPKSAGATAKFYQLIGNDRDIGMFYNSLAAGQLSYIMGMFNTALTTAATTASFTPSYLQFSSYNTANWINAAKYVSQANRVPRTDLIAYGDYSALAKVLPSGTTQDSSLSILAGAEWMNQGYLGTVMGVRSYAIDNVMLPNSHVTVGTQMMPTNRIYMAASSGAAPIWIGFEDGTPVTLEISPSNTADQSLDINLTMSIDVIPVCSSKLAVISNV